MFNLGAMWKAKKLWDRFSENHPRVPGFLAAVNSRGLHVGDVIEISITDENGQRIESNLKVTASDLEILNEAKNMSKDAK